MDNFEELLQARESTNKSRRATRSAIKNKTSEKGTSMFGFISMVQKVVTLAMAEIDVEMIPDEGKIPITDPSEKIDKSYITYKLISRKRKQEIKPRHREEFVEDVPSGKRRIGNIFGQKFDCIIQFNVFSSVYEDAELVMERFEEAMFSYSGFFKRNGVGEIFFQEQKTDESLDIFRQSVSVRSLQYYVEIEKTMKVYEDVISSINAFDNEDFTSGNDLGNENNKETSTDGEGDSGASNGSTQNGQNQNDQANSEKEDLFDIDKIVVSDEIYETINPYE